MTIKEFLITENANYSNYPEDTLTDIVKDLHLHFERYNRDKDRKGRFKYPSKLIYTDINYKYRYYETGKQLIKLF